MSELGNLPMRPAQCGDVLEIREVSGRTMLVSAYPDENLYLRTGMEIIFEHCISYKNPRSGGTLTSRFRRAILKKRNVLLLPDKTEIPIADLVPHQTARIAAKDITEQLKGHDLVKI